MTLLCIIIILFTLCDLAECDWANMTRREITIELVLVGLTTFACGWAIAWGLLA